MRKNVVATLVLLAACSCGSEDQAPRVSPIESQPDARVDVPPDTTDAPDTGATSETGTESSDVIVDDHADVTVEPSADATPPDTSDEPETSDDVVDTGLDVSDAGQDVHGEEDSPVESDVGQDVIDADIADSQLPCPSTVVVLHKTGAGGKISSPTMGYVWTSGAQLSVEFWVRFNNDGVLNNSNYVGVSTRQVTDQDTWSCYANPKLGTINFATKLATGALSTAWSPSLGVWYHIACQYDGVARMVFVNGSLLIKEPHTGGVDTTSNVIVFAAKSSSEYATWGDYHLREVRIGGKATYVVDFEPSWMLAPTQGTSGLYHLDEGSGATVHDSLHIAPDMTVVDGWGAPIGGGIDAFVWETVQSQCND